MNTPSISPMTRRNFSKLLAAGGAGFGLLGALPKRAQMKFAPNTGYAFAVGDDTWHSADPVGSEVKSRDSILLTYFVDTGMLRYVRNRAKRIGNFLLNELRSRTQA